jgi:hypothetical protein
MPGEFPGFHGGIARAGALAAGRGHAQAGLAHAFGATSWVTLALTVAALAPALLLPGSRPAPRTAGPVRP